MSLATAPVMWRGFRVVRPVSGWLMIRDRTKRGLDSDQPCPSSSREAVAMAAAAHVQADATETYVLPTPAPLDMAAAHRARRLRALARLYEDIALYLESEERQ